jgi:hypothetical protein
MSAEGAIDVISHAAPTDCTQVPIFENSVAIHSARKNGRRNGASAELDGRCTDASGLMALLNGAAGRGRKPRRRQAAPIGAFGARRASGTAKLENRGRAFRALRGESKVWHHRLSTRMGLSWRQT